MRVTDCHWHSLFFFFFLVQRVSCVFANPRDPRSEHVCVNVSHLRTTRVKRSALSTVTILNKLLKINRNMNEIVVINNFMNYHNYFMWCLFQKPRIKFCKISRWRWVSWLRGRASAELTVGRRRHSGPVEPSFVRFRQALYSFYM